MVPTIRCWALEIISDVVLNTDTDKTALVGDVAESQAEASANEGGGEESGLLETAAVGATAPAEQMAPALVRDEAPMAHGASAARGNALDAEQSVALPAGGSLSREVEEQDVSGDTEEKEALVKEVKAVIESGDQNLLFLCGVAMEKHCYTMQYITALWTQCNS